jgi:hypothetical protein
MIDATVPARGPERDIIASSSNVGGKALIKMTAPKVPRVIPGTPGINMGIVLGTPNLFDAIKCPNSWTANGAKIIIVRIKDLDITSMFIKLFFPGYIHELIHMREVI